MNPKEVIELFKNKKKGSVLTNVVVKWSDYIPYYFRTNLLREILTDKKSDIYDRIHIHRKDIQTLVVSLKKNEVSRRHVKVLSEHQALYIYHLIKTGNTVTFLFIASYTTLREAIYNLSASMIVKEELQKAFGEDIHVEFVFTFISVEVDVDPDFWNLVSFTQQNFLNNQLDATVPEITGQNFE